MQIVVLLLRSVMEQSKLEQDLRFFQTFNFSKMGVATLFLLQRRDSLTLMHDISQVCTTPSVASMYGIRLT